LSGIAEQAKGYQQQLPTHLANWDDPLRFDYEASGSETLFSDRADPNSARARCSTSIGPKLCWNGCRTARRCAAA